MGASSSNLSDPKYGYDFVVATTQESINAALKTFMSKIKSPVVNCCWVADDKGRPTRIDYQKLLAESGGTDPFALPNGTDPSDQNFKNLLNARFMMGFRAKIGIPPGLAPDKVPDVVALGVDTASVMFNLLCEQFTVVQLTPSGGYASWMNVSQPSGEPWIFTSKVDMRMSKVDQSKYSKLPPDVQKKIKEISGDTFTIQQLFYDLDNAALETIPTISGVQPGSPLHTLLMEEFCGGYFTQMQSSGEVVLGYFVAHQSYDASTLKLTDFNFNVNPFVGPGGSPVADPTPIQKDLTTLNYLCAANGDVLPPAALFNWNWVDESEESDFDGIVAINRIPVVQYFKSQLAGSVSRNCYLPSVTVSYEFPATANYKWSLSRGLTPQEVTPTGNQVLCYHYEAAASDSTCVGTASMDLKPSFDLSVEFVNNTIVITQHLVVWAQVTNWPLGSSGNVVDKQITDTYTLAVDSHGALTAILTTAPAVDKSVNLSGGDWDWFGFLSQLTSNVNTWAKTCVSTNLTDIPVSFAQDFVFPGGNAFAFKSVAFSNNKDLVAHITYTDPS
jgi:hypothetical protein